MYKERRLRSQAEGVEKRAVAVAKLQSATDEDWRQRLWNVVAAYESVVFTTSGRGSRPGVTFSYSVSRTADQKGGGSRYDGPGVEGFGNELWVTTASGTDEAVKLKKSISRSTVELGFRKAVDL